MKKPGLLLFILISTAALLSAEDFSIDYLQGKLEYQNHSGNWIQLETGDTVKDTYTLKLSEDGFAELSGSNGKITLTEDGSYSMREIADRSSQSGNSIKKALASKFSFLFKKRQSSGNTVAAVRADKADNTDDFITWEDDSTDYLASGNELFRQGNYIKAKEAYEEGTLWETGGIKRECVFRKGLCEQIAGNPETARKTLESVNPEKTDSFLGEYSLVMAALYSESMEYEKADSVLTNYLSTNPSGYSAQTAWFLSAAVKDALGDSEGCRYALNKVISINPESELAADAKEMLD